MSVVVQLLKAVWDLFWANRLSAFNSNSPSVIYFI